MTTTVLAGVNGLGQKNVENSATMIMADDKPEGAAMVAALQERLALTEDRLRHFEDANLDLRAQLALARSEKSSGEDPERKQMYEQLKYKDNRIMELNNVITEKERRIMDLQELCREQSQVASSKKAAVAIVNRRLRELDERQTRDASTEVDASLTDGSAGGRPRRNESPGRVRAAGRAAGGVTPPPSDPSEAFFLRLERGDGKLAAGRKRVTFEFEAASESASGLTHYAPRPASAERGGDFSSSARDFHVLAEENKQLRVALAEAKAVAAVRPTVQHKSTEMDYTRQSPADLTTTGELTLTNTAETERDNRMRIVKARAAAQSRIRELEENIARLQMLSIKELENANAINETLNANRDWLIQENANLLKKNDSLKSKVDDLHGELDASVDANAMYRQRLDYVERQADALAAELADVRRSLHHAQDTKQVLISEVERLKEALFAQDELIGVLEGDLIVYEEHVGMLRDSLGASQREHRQTIKSKAYAAKLNALEMEKKEIMKRSNDDRLLAKALGVKVQCLEKERDELLQRLRQLESLQLQLGSAQYQSVNFQSTPFDSAITALPEILHPVARGAAGQPSNAVAEPELVNGDSKSSSPFTPIVFERPSAAALTQFETAPVPVAGTSRPVAKPASDQILSSSGPDSIAPMEVAGWSGKATAIARGWSSSQPPTALLVQPALARRASHHGSDYWANNRLTQKKEPYHVSEQNRESVDTVTLDKREVIRRLDEYECQRLAAAVESERRRADESIESERRRADESIETTRRRADETIESMRRELNDYFQQRLSELTAMLAVYEQKAGTVGEELAAVMTRNDALIAERDEEIDRRAKTERMIVDCVQRHCLDDNEITEQQTAADQLERLAAFIDNLNQQLATVSSEKNALELASMRTATDLAAQRTAIRELESAKIGLTTLNDRLADERDDFSRRVAAGGAALAGATARLADLEHQLNEANDKTQLLAAELSAAVERAEALAESGRNAECGLKAAEQFLSEVTAEKEQLEQKVAALRDSNSRLAAQLEREKARLERLVELLRAEVDRFRVETQMSRNCLEDLRHVATTLPEQQQQQHQQEKQQAEQQQQQQQFTVNLEQPATLLKQQSEAEHIELPQQQALQQQLKQQNDFVEEQQTNENFAQQRIQQNPPTTTSFDNFKDCFVVSGWPQQKRQQQQLAEQQQLQESIIEEQQKPLTGQQENQPNVVVDSVVRDLEEMVAGTPIRTAPGSTVEDHSLAIKPTVQDYDSKSDDTQLWIENEIHHNENVENIIRNDDHTENEIISNVVNEELIENKTMNEVEDGFIIDNINAKSTEYLCKNGTEVEPNKTKDEDVETQINMAESVSVTKQVDEVEETLFEADAESESVNATKSDVTIEPQAGYPMSRKNENGIKVELAQESKDAEFAAQMLDDIQRLLVLKSELETSVDVLKSEIWSLNNQLRKQLYEHEEAAERLRVCEQRLAEAEARLRERDGDVTRLRAELADRGDDFSRLCEEKAKIEAESAALAQRCNQLQQELSAGVHLFDELAEISRLSDTLETCNGELRVALDTERNTAAGLRVALDAERNTVAELRAALDGGRDELTALRDKKTRLDAEVGALRAEFTQLQASYAAQAVTNSTEKRSNNTISEDDRMDNGKREQQKIQPQKQQQQHDYQQQQEQQQKSRSLPSLPAVPGAACNKYRSLGAPLTASLVHPLNVQLAIIAARLDAKSADNAALQRANAELAYTNSRLLASVEALEARVAEISAAGNLSPVNSLSVHLAAADDAVAIEAIEDECHVKDSIPAEIQTSNIIPEHVVSVEAFIEKKATIAGADIVTAISAAEVSSTSVVIEKTNPKTKAHKSTKGEPRQTVEQIHQTNSSHETGDKPKEVDIILSTSQVKALESTIPVNDGFAATRLFDAALGGAATVRAAMADAASALIDLRIADNGNSTTGDGFSAMLDGLRANVEDNATKTKETVEDQVAVVENNVEQEETSRNTKHSELKSEAPNSQESQDDWGKAWDNEDDNVGDDYNNEAVLSAASSRVTVVPPHGSEYFSKPGDSQANQDWNEAVWSDEDQNDEDTIQSQAETVDAVGPADENDSWDW